MGARTAVAGALVTLVAALVAYPPSRADSPEPDWYRQACAIYKELGC